MKKQVSKLALNKTTVNRLEDASNTKGGATSFICDIIVLSIRICNTLSPEICFSGNGCDVKGEM